MNKYMGKSAPIQYEYCERVAWFFLLNRFKEHIVLSLISPSVAVRVWGETVYMSETGTTFDKAENETKWE